jgi:hypothetical protein
VAFRRRFLANRLEKDVCPMIFVSYRWTHLPTGETGVRECLPYLSLKDFEVALSRWNAFDPEVWKYELVRVVNKGKVVGTA